MPCPLTAALVVIPALNEAARIGRVVEALAREVPDVDILVVDDGSRDATVTIARASGALVVRHPFNLGYGAALQTGYKFADQRQYEYLVQMDADGQHHARDVPRLLGPLRAGVADVVLGSRFVEPTGYDMGVPRTLGRAFLQRVLRLAGGPRITDPTSGFQAFTRPAYQFCCSDLYPSDFPDIDVLLLLHRAGFRIVEVSARMAPSPADRPSMHAGLRAVYYTVNMLLATVKSRWSVLPSAAARRRPTGER
jgi:hypothetical protein